MIDPRHESKQRTLSTVGILLLGVAVVVGLYGLVSFSHGFFRPSSEFFANPDRVMDEDRRSGFIGITCMAIGGFALVAALRTLAFAKAGSILRYASAEATPVVVDTFNDAAQGAQDGIERIAGAVSRGVATGVESAASSQPSAVTVKVRCRACGYLDSEDAKFCSGCGAAM